VFATKLQRVQRVQLASILLATTFTNFKSLAFLTIKYRDLDLFLLRDLISELLTMMLRITLTKIKDQTKRKRS
jgi:hypothetical protein